MKFWDNLPKGGRIFMILLIVGGLAAGYVKFLKPYLDSNAPTETDKKPASDSKSFSLFKHGDEMNIALNTWSGFDGIILMNEGIVPNENSRLYKEYGIKLTIKIMDVLNDSRAAFKNGDVNVVYCTTDALPVEMGSKSDFASMNVEQFFQLDWSRGGDAIVVTKAIKTVADLKGKTIAFAEGTASHTLLIKVLESNGLKATDVIMKKCSDGIEAANIFKAGQVDAAVVWSPDDGACVKTIKDSKVLISSKNASSIIADGLIAKKEYITKNHDLLVKFCTAWLIGNAELNASKEGKDSTAVKNAAKLFSENFLGGKDYDVALLGINNVRFCTLEDNKNFFGLNSVYQGQTGDQLYTKMSLVYSGIKLVQNPIAWRNVSETSIIEAIKLNDPSQAAETATKFSPVTDAIKSKEAISNKKVTINFETNSANLDDDDKATIDKEFVSIAKSFKDTRIRVEGNTDNVGSAVYNLDLSKRRAQSVVEYLVTEYGFDTNRFIIIGNGSKKAIAAGDKGSNDLYRKTDFQLVSE